MKIILAVLKKSKEDVAVEALNKEGFFATRLSSAGGFLKKNNTTVLVGTEDDKVKHAIEILRSSCEDSSSTPEEVIKEGDIYKAISIKEGSCTIFVLDVDKMEKF